jgi:hypothetical protein
MMILLTALLAAASLVVARKALTPQKRTVAVRKDT